MIFSISASSSLLTLFAIDEAKGARHNEKDDYFLSQLCFTAATHIALGTSGMPALLWLRNTSIH